MNKHWRASMLLSMRGSADVVMQMKTAREQALWSCSEAILQHEVRFEAWLAAMVSKLSGPWLVQWVGCRCFCRSMRRGDHQRLTFRHVSVHSGRRDCRRDSLYSRACTLSFAIAQTSRSSVADCYLLCQPAIEMWSALRRLAGKRHNWQHIALDQGEDASAGCFSHLYSCARHRHEDACRVLVVEEQCRKRRWACVVVVARLARASSGLSQPLSRW